MDVAGDGRLVPLFEVPAVPFTAAELTGLRHEVARFAAKLLHGDRLDDFVVAVYEILTNAVRHGGGAGRLRMSCVDGEVVCQVDDDGPGFRFAVRPGDLLSETGGRGLQLAREFTDALVITQKVPGTSVQLRISTGYPKQG